MSLEEQAGWPLTDDPAVISERDIDMVAEIAEADAQADHDYGESPRFCCDGRNYWCGEHWGWVA